MTCAGQVLTALISYIDFRAWLVPLTVSTTMAVMIPPKQANRWAFGVRNQACCRRARMGCDKIPRSNTANHDSGFGAGLGAPEVTEVGRSGLRRWVTEACDSSSSKPAYGEYED